MATMIVFFSKSPKRQKNVQSMEYSTASKQINFETHWVARLDALELFFDLYPAVMRSSVKVS